MQEDTDLRNKFLQIKADVKIIDAKLVAVKEDVIELNNSSKDYGNNLFDVKINFNEKLSLLNNNIVELSTKIVILKNELESLQITFENANSKVEDSMKDRLLLINTRLDQLNDNPFISFTNTLDFKKTVILIVSLVSLLGGPEALILLKDSDVKSTQPLPIQK